MSTPLPEGWQEHKDEDGDTYYWHTATGDSCWDRPSATEEAVTQAQMQAQQAAAAAPTIKSFLDPTLAAGFPQRIRKEEQRTEEERAAADLVKGFISTVEEGDAGPSSAVPEPDAAASDLVADFMRDQDTDVHQSAYNDNTAEVVSGATVDMSAFEEPSDDLYAEDTLQIESSDSMKRDNDTNSQESIAQTASSDETESDNSLTAAELQSLDREVEAELDASMSSDHDNDSHDLEAQQQGAGQKQDVGEVDRSLTYNQLLEMKKRGITPPGVRTIDDKPRGPLPDPSVFRSDKPLSTLKPWERARQMLTEDDSDEDHEAQTVSDSESDATGRGVFSSDEDSVDCTVASSGRLDSREVIEDTPRTQAQLNYLDETPGSIWDASDSSDDSQVDSDGEDNSATGRLAFSTDDDNTDDDCDVVEEDPGSQDAQVVADIDSEADLPYDGDLQKAIAAQDRDAIRTLIQARDSTQHAEGNQDKRKTAEPLDLDRPQSTHPAALGDNSARGGTHSGPTEPAAYSRGSAAGIALLIGAAVWAGLTALQKWRQKSDVETDSSTRNRAGIPVKVSPPPLSPASSSSTVRRSRRTTQAAKATKGNKSGKRQYATGRPKGKQVPVQQRKQRAVATKTPARSKRRSTKSRSSKKAVRAKKPEMLARL